MPFITDLFNWAKFSDKPEIDNQPSLLKFASDAGDTAHLICRSNASPLARYAWSKSGATLNPNTTGKYYSSYRQLDPLTTESILLITHVTSADYGSYECVARNDLGFSSITVKLDVTSPPDPPSDLNAANVTHDSVTLVWRPGFDGGMKASYRIRYRKIDNDAYKYEDVVPANATRYTIQGLDVNTQYVFSVMAMNQLGNSNYLPDLLSLRTSSKCNSYLECLFLLMLWSSQY